MYNTAGVLQRTVDVSAVNAGLIEDMTFDYSVVLPQTSNNDFFQVRYAANLNIGDSVVDITNTGASNSANLCANVYTFDPAEELISCCTCHAERTSVTLGPKVAHQQPTHAGYSDRCGG